jgi:hypothetical protein
MSGMSDTSVVTLLYECRSSGEYDRLSTSETESEIRVSRQEAPKTLKMWAEVLQLRVGHVNTLAEWMTFHVDVRPPGALTDTDDVTRRVVSACVVGSRDRDGYPEGLRVIVAKERVEEPVESVEEPVESVEEPVETVTTIEPADYHFLRWVWSNLDDLCRCDPSRIAEAYTRRTGKDCPYEDEGAVRMREMLDEYRAATTDPEEGEPYLVEHLAYETDDLPQDEDVVRSIGEAVATYYPLRYASGILHSVRSVRVDARKRDRLWGERLRWCTAWKFRWEMGDEDKELAVGSTCTATLERWRGEYAQLTILEPSSEYAVVQEGEYYVYDVDTLDLYTDADRWDQALVDESVREGHIIGVFAYETREEAEQAQSMRILKA